MKERIGRFEVNVFAGVKNGNCCQITKYYNDAFYSSLDRVNVKDLLDLQYLVKRTLRELEGV